MKYRIATAAYPLDYFENLDAYKTKLTHWVKSAADRDARLLVFPEYGAMELATLAGPDAAWDLEGSLRAVSDRIPEADAIHRELAQAFDVYILAGSAPVFDPAFGDRPVNRARFFAPSGDMSWQDKQIMTRFEREQWGVVPGGPLTVFDTDLGRIGVLICYDAEFPLLGRDLADADVILAPSCTDALAGYSRVRIGAMSIALENQCVVAMSSTVGSCEWSQAVDENVGMGGVFGPPDLGFPPTGVLAEGELNTPGWTYATVDLDVIATVRTEGAVFNRRHWKEQNARVGNAAMRKLT